MSNDFADAVKKRVEYLASFKAIEQDELTAPEGKFRASFRKVANQIYLIGDYDSRAAAQQATETTVKRIRPVVAFVFDDKGEMLFQTASEPLSL